MEDLVTHWVGADFLLFSQIWLFFLSFNFFFFSLRCPLNLSDNEGYLKPSSLAKGLRQHQFYDGFIIVIETG